LSWTLQTSDTAVQVEAGASCPVVAVLRGEAGWNWASSGTDVLLPRRLAVGELHSPPEWTYAGAEFLRHADSDRLALTYKTARYDITLTSIWTAYAGPGPVVHEMRIANRSGRSITVYNPESLDVELSAGDAPVDVFYVSKDRFAPRSVGTQRNYGTYLEALTDRYHAEVWTSIDIDDTGFIPLVMLHVDGRHGIYAGWEWNEGRIHVAGRQKEARLYAGITAGLPGDFCTELPDGHEFEVPGVFIGAFAGDLDDASNRLRKWLFAHRMPERNRVDENIPYVQWNGFWNTGEPQGSWFPVASKYYPMVDAIAGVGIEEVTIDVGWWQTFGDFRGHDERWALGMADASRYAHERGMLFTLYFAFLDGGSEDPLALTSRGPSGHPEWFAQRWTADMGIDACRDFAKEMVLLRLNEYDVDTLRSDLSPIARRKAPGNPHQGCNDGPYWAQRGFAHFLDYLLDNRPGLRYQNCNNGGALKGYDLMKRSTSVQVTDTYSALDVRQAVWDSVYAFPLMQLLTQFGDTMAGGKMARPSYRYRSYLIGAPSAHFELPTEMEPEEAEALARLIGIYKQRVRPLVRHADVYHVLPRPDGRAWDGLQLYEPQRGSGLLSAFRPDNAEAEMRIRLKRLEPDAVYRLEYCDGTLETCEATGRELMETGVRVVLEERLSAEWVFFERIRVESDQN